MIISPNTNKKPSYEIRIELGSSKTVPLHRDVLHTIFKMASENLHNIALVCKEWQNAADDHHCRELIRPPMVFGNREWKEYIGVDAGLEPKLPRHAYRDMTGSHYLIFIPNSVKVPQKKDTEDKTSTDGEKIKELLLDSVKVIKDLFATRIPEIKVIISSDSWEKAIKEKRNVDKPHWVLIQQSLYDYQFSLTAQQAHLKAHNWSQLNLIDAVITIFAEFVRTTKCTFYLGEQINKNDFYLKFIEETDGWQIAIGLAPGKIRVLNYFDVCEGESIVFGICKKSYEFL